jgi:TRAP-type mannitol/chloroaromatic compound transport system permease small subunit
MGNIVGVNSPIYYMKTLRTIALKILYIKGFTLILKVINLPEPVLVHSNYTPTASHDSILLL